ncbi:AUXIN RESPONSE FACTOR 13 [Arabidopsis thaliana]|uniref:Auxin response factor n=2 Tax=Arabidopsis thaliana TaxID=3702 RepID=F4HT52_ARATH|nr:AUXIN RESPONSE FACTOR 13 [Arabidopsis thaliana]AEE31681.1 AUXIN RESPONSE FACTOR 13 [Arabidopsis thaliana]|eukprot:NP_001154393.1 AUXIN RESPONSE FACTOR 13 [Arabidopsis thaliana]
MENNGEMNAQPELSVDITKTYMYEKLWNICAGPLCVLPKPGEKVYYFPQGHIELIENSTRDELDHIRPIFDLPSKLRCRVVAIDRKVDKNTDEVYAQISLMPDTTEVMTHNTTMDTRRPIVYFFSKILTASDVSLSGGLIIPKQYAIECFPPLDMSQPISTQNLVAKDLYGQEWSFKHVFRGTPQRHMFTSGGGWSVFATTKRLIVGDIFVLLRGENGELRFGIRRAKHQQGHIPSSVISANCMQHGVIASVVNAFKTKCMFNVVYKPRMQFEGKDFSEKRYDGTIIGVNDMSPHWKDSEWRSLKVQWDELSPFLRPNQVSPWDIEHLIPSSDISQSSLKKKKHWLQLNEIGATLSNLWTCQEIGQRSMNSPISVPEFSYPNAIEDSKFLSGLLLNHSLLAIPNENYNSDQMIQPRKEDITTEATTSCLLFGVDLTKVHMQGVAISRAVDLTAMHGYNQLIQKLEELFDLKDELRTRNQWEIVFTNNEGAEMLVGDDPWPEFCNMAKRIFICSKEEIKKMKLKNKFFQPESKALTSSDVPPNVTDN